MYSKSELNRELKKFVDRKETEKSLYTKELNEKLKIIADCDKEIDILEKVRTILQQVGKETQMQLSFQIEEIVNLAINSVFEEVEYKFKIEFIEKRNQLEADMYLMKGEARLNPMNANGGGLVDILSFALRISLWTLSRTGKTIILDEPFRFLSKNLQEKAGMILKELSEKLEIQFIIVSHEEAIIDCANKTFTITQENDISRIIN